MPLPELSLVKEPFKKENYTKDQLVELALCSDRTTGPMHFLLNYFYIIHPTKGREIIKPFPYQLGLLDAMSKHRFSINLLSRQLGKCVCYDTYVKVRNKKTGEIMEIQIGDFFNLVKKDNGHVVE